MINNDATSLITNECLGVVLAGGLSSRMGQSKAQLLRNESSKLSMLTFSKQILSGAGIHNIVVSGDHYDVADKVKKWGPVGGILSVLVSYPQVKSLLILPVDLPLITATALTELRIKGELSQQATYYTNHYLPLYLPNNAYVELFIKNMLTKTSTATEIKGPSIKLLLNQMPHQALPCQNDHVLFNSNTPEQWQLAKQQINSN